MLAGIIFVISAAMMIFAARGDLAIDEVVSLNKAPVGVQSWTDIFTRDQNDDNHLLNTLLMHAWGPGRRIFLFTGFRP